MFTNVIGDSAQYSSGSRVVARMIWPSRASTSTGAWFQKARKLPVSFCAAMVCSAQFSEKKLVSPEKYVPGVSAGTSTSGSLPAGEAIIGAN
jgi:hypothetical protein